MKEIIFRRLKELKFEIDSIDMENIGYEMNGLINKLSSSNNENDLAELLNIKEQFGILSRNMLNLADFLERKFPEK